MLWCGIPVALLALSDRAHETLQDIAELLAYIAFWIIVHVTVSKLGSVRRSPFCRSFPFLTRHSSALPSA